MGVAPRNRLGQWNAADVEYHRELCQRLVEQNRYSDLRTYRQVIEAASTSDRVRDPFAPGRAPILIRNFLDGKIDVIDFLMDAEQIAPSQWVYDVENDQRNDPKWDNHPADDPEWADRSWAFKVACVSMWILCLGGPAFIALIMG